MNAKLCFYTPPFPGVKSYYEMIDAAVEHGTYAVEGLGIFELENPDIEVAKKIKEYADSKGVTFPCFSVYVRFITENDWTNRLKKYADVAKILGAPYLHHTIVGECREWDIVLQQKDALFESGVAAVREIYDYAESIGIKTIYEEQGYIFNGISGFGRFLNAVERDVGVVADFGNIYQVGDDLLDFIKAFGDKVVHAHIKDAILVDANEDGKGLKTLTGQYMYEAPPETGKGIVKMKEAIALLAQFGYDGYYGLEFGAKEDNAAFISDSIKLVQSWFSSLD